MVLGEIAGWSCRTPQGPYQRAGGWVVWEGGRACDCGTLCGSTAVRGLWEARLWYTRGCGTHEAVVHTRLWYTRGCGTHEAVVHTRLWYTRGCGTHEAVVHTRLWYTRGCGTQREASTTMLQFGSAEFDGRATASDLPLSGGGPHAVPPFPTHGTGCVGSGDALDLIAEDMTEQEVSSYLMPQHEGSPAAAAAWVSNGTTLAYTHLRSPTLAYARLHSHTHTLAYTRLHSPTLAYTRLHSPTLAYTRLHSPTLAYIHYTRLHSPTFTYIHLHSPTLTYSVGESRLQGTLIVQHSPTLTTTWHRVFIYTRHTTWVRYSLT